MNVPRASTEHEHGLPSPRDAALQVLAEFDLDGIHCLLLPVDSCPPGSTRTDPTTADRVAGGGPSGARPLCGFELDGRRYVLYARNGPGRSADAEHEDPLASLTAREQQIVRLVCLGMVNKQIADKLRISEYTVKTYLKQIFCKLNVHSRSAMVYRCAAWSTVRPLREA